MKKLTTHSYNINFTDSNDTCLNLAKESAQIYNQTLDFFWASLDNDSFLSKFDLINQVTVPRTLLHSQSYQGSIQLAHTAILIYFNIIKKYKSNPSNFSGCPRQPNQHKDIQMIIFKKSAIRFKDGYILLSTKEQPLKFRWDINKGMPIHATISWQRTTGWQLNLVLEEEKDLVEFVENKLLAIDLGIKRIATTYDLDRVILYSGKIIMSLNRLRNKINGETQVKLSGLKKHSKKYKKIKRANRKVAKRINNKIKDILHKYSRTIVNYCVENEIGTIVVGDCSSIHNAPNLGKKNNQKIVQHPEQRLLRYIKYKFEDIGGIVETIPEAYTSRTCPVCGMIKNHSPSSRIFKCQGCGFKYDRDGVGAINIYGKKVSCDDELQAKVSFGLDLSRLDVVGGLTPPIGWIYKSSRDCLIKI